LREEIKDLKDKMKVYTEK